MSYNAFEIAQYIIFYEGQAGRNVNNLRLQKLLYFVQAKYLVEREKPLFEERMEAWNFGPVVLKVYRKYRYYGLVSIPCKNEYDNFSIQSDDRKIIDSMLDSCSKYATSTLIDIVHGQDPWIQAHQSKDRTITPLAIYSYFIKRVAEL